MMRKTLKQLQDRRAQLKQQMEAINSAPAGEDGISLSAEQDAAYKALETQRDAVKAALAREQELQQEERDLVTNAVTDITVADDRAGNKPWASAEEQFMAIVAAGCPTGMALANGMRGGSVDPRLYGAASGHSAGVGSDGGFQIQKDFSAELFKEAFAAGALTSRCDTSEVGANSDGLEVRYIDETSRATGSRWGSVQVYRVAEAETVTSAKVKIGKWELRLEDMMGLAYVTDRLLQDGGAMMGVIRQGFTEEFSFMADDEVYRGDGVGRCLGILNHVWNSTTGLGSVVSVAKESGQANDTVVAENIINIWSKVLPSAKARGAWFINTEVTPQLSQMQIGTGTSGQLVYLPAGGLSGASFGTIYGRPVIEIEHASALGDLGDIAYLDLSRYKLITKGGLQEAESMHVRFLYNERAFRWVTRFNGAPKLKAAITPYKGASGSKLSPFVTLAAR